MYETPRPCTSLSRSRALDLAPSLSTSFSPSVSLSLTSLVTALTFAPCCSSARTTSTFPLLLEAISPVAPYRREKKRKECALASSAC